MKTLISINVPSNLPLQKPLAATSNFASSPVFALRVERISPERGCRWGSMQTSWNTSVRRFARRSRISLSDDGKSTRWTGEGMLDSEVCATDTVGGHVG